MIRNRIKTEYFSWLVDYVCGDRFADGISYNRLLAYLYEIEFTYLNPMDQNRAENGVGLKYSFAMTQGYEDEAEEVLDILDAPCSVFEMMVALSIQAEDIMDNPTVGDRTGQWFWTMIANLGLGSMRDDKFNKVYVDEVITRFLNREYEPNGKGGLFVIRNCEYDLRDIEIWVQMLWYINGME